MLVKCVCLHAVRLWSVPHAERLHVVFHVAQRCSVPLARCQDACAPDAEDACRSSLEPPLALWRRAGIATAHNLPVGDLAPAAWLGRRGRRRALGVASRPRRRSRLSADIASRLGSPPSGRSFCLALRRVRGRCCSRTAVGVLNASRGRAGRDPRGVARRAAVLRERRLDGARLRTRGQKRQTVSGPRHGADHSRLAHVRHTAAAQSHHEVGPGCIARGRDAGGGAPQPLNGAAPAAWGRGVGGQAGRGRPRRHDYRSSNMSDISFSLSVGSRSRTEPAPVAQPAPILVAGAWRLGAGAGSRVSAGRKAIGAAAFRATAEGAPVIADLSWGDLASAKARRGQGDLRASGHEQTGNRFLSRSEVSGRRGACALRLGRQRHPKAAGTTSLALLGCNDAVPSSFIQWLRARLGSGRRVLMPMPQ